MMSKEVLEKLTTEEKAFLLYCVLYDIRCNWGDNPAPRTELAIILCYYLELEKPDCGFKTLAAECFDYLFHIKPDDPDCDYDGRFFRDDFPYGYEGLEKFFDMPRTYNNMSDSFKLIADKFITCPNFVFDDRRD